MLLAFFLTYSAYAFSQQFQKESFYKKNSYEYQKWLVNSGFSKIIQVETTEITDNKLHLILITNYQHADSATVSWKELKKQFENEHNYELEKLLLYNAVNSLKIEPELLMIEVLNRLDEPDLLVEITFESSKVCVTNSVFRTKNAGFTIDIGDIRNKSIKVNLKNDQLNRKQIYEQILLYAKSRYSKFEKGNDVELSYIPGNNEKLIFMVSGLRQEVLTKEENIWVANLLNKVFDSNDYDWRRVEVLKFTFTYQNMSNKSVFIDCEIDGRYGSGYYKTTDWNKCIPMDPEFDWFLQKYTDDFRTAIYELLSKQ